jgi:hypothetical protein
MIFIQNGTTQLAQEMDVMVHNNWYSKKALMDYREKETAITGAF